jgi:predicted RNA methylase
MLKSILSQWDERERLHLVLNDAKTFSLPKQFDIVVCNLVMLHLLPEEQDAVFTNMVHHTKDQGLIFCQWPKSTKREIRDRASLEECVAPVSSLVRLCKLDTDCIEEPGKYWNAVFRKVTPAVIMTKPEVDEEPDYNDVPDW